MCSFIYKDTNKSQSGSYNYESFPWHRPGGLCAWEKTQYKNRSPRLSGSSESSQHGQWIGTSYPTKTNTSPQRTVDVDPPYCHTLSHFHKYDNRRGTAGCCFRGNNSTMILTLSRYRDDILLYTERSSAHLLMD